MTVTRSDILEMIRETSKGNQFVAIMQDWFDYGCYPVGYRDKAALDRALADRSLSHGVDRWMEVYDLSKPLEPQVAKSFNWEVGA